MTDPTPDPLSSSERKWLAEIAAVTAERDEARARLAEAEALLREIRDNGDRYNDWVDYEQIDAYFAGDPDA